MRRDKPPWATLLAEARDGLDSESCAPNVAGDRRVINGAHRPDPGHGGNALIDLAIVEFASRRIALFRSRHRYLQRQQIRRIEARIDG
jgi:hypothetical protein